MNRYSPILSRLETSANTAGGLGGFAPLPGIALTVPGNQLYPGSALYSRTGINDTASVFQSQDRPFIRRFAVFGNFADGLVLDTTTGADPVVGKFAFSLLFRYCAAADPLPVPGVANGFRLFFDTLNTWQEVDRFLPFYGVDEYAAPKAIFGAFELFRFRTDAIDPAFNGEDARFVLALEVEHTYPLA